MRLLDTTIDTPELDSLILSTYARRDSAAAAHSPSRDPSTPSTAAVASTRTAGWKSSLIRYQSPPTRPPIAANLGDGLQRAVSAIRDARYGRATAQPTEEWKFKAYNAHYSRLFLASLFLASAVQHASVFWERVSYRDPSSTGETGYVILLLVELAVLSVFSADAAFTAIHHGPRGFWSKPWRSVSGVCLALFWVDLIAFASGCPVRFSRALRPVYLISRWRRVRTTLRAVLRTFAPLVPVLSKVVIADFVYAVAGVALFRGQFSTGVPYENFNNVGSASLLLFVVLTGQGFPEYWYIGSSINLFSGPFFVSYALITSYLLATETVAVLMRFYKWHRKRSVVYDRWKERSSIASAYLALSRPSVRDPNTEVLPWSSVSALASLLSPAFPHQELRTLFKDLALEEETDVIDMSGFFTLIDVVYLRYSPPSKTVEVLATLPSISALQDVDNAPVANLIWLGCLVAFCVLCATVTGDSIPEPSDVRSIVAGILFGLFWIEVLVHALGNGRRYFADPWSWFEMGALLVGSVGYVIHQVFDVHWAWTITTLTTVRLLAVAPPVRHHVENLLLVMPSLAPSLFLILALLYMYAVIGMEIFDQELTSRANFNSFGVALRTVYQCASGSQWQNVMYEAMRNTHPSAALYFVSGVILWVLFFTRLVSALLLQIYTLVADLRSSPAAAGGGDEEGRRMSVAEEDLESGGGGESGGGEGRELR